MSYIKSLEKMRKIAEEKDVIRVDFKCINKENRDRNKLAEYKTMGLCPVFEDDICCGGCSLNRECDFCAGCSCQGFVIAALGGKKSFYSKPASEYSLGSVDENGNFNWEEYYINLNRRNNKDIIGKFLFIYDSKNESEILSEIKDDNTIRCKNISTGEEYDYFIGKGLLVVHEYRKF